MKAGLIAGAVVLAAIGAWLLIGGEGDASAPVVTARDDYDVPAEPQSAAVGPGGAAKTPAVMAPSIASKPDHAARFRTATNYLDFVRETRPAAMAGDPRAQIYLYRALKSCSNDYRFLFRFRNRYISYEDGLQLAAKRLPYRPEYARIVHARCHGLFEPMDPDVENPDVWLRRAAEGRDPLALAMVSSRSFASEDEVDGMKIVNEGSSEEEARIAKRQLATAIRSKDPEVILEVAQRLHPTDAPGEPSVGITFEWMLAACYRGLDCSSSSHVVTGFCLWDWNCQPYESLVDVVQRMVGSEFAGIDARAREINTLIDAGKWEELGFGETIDDP